jgi:hypothetical protein
MFALIDLDETLLNRSAAFARWSSASPMRGLWTKRTDDGWRRLIVG